MTDEIGRMSLYNNVAVVAGLAFKWYDASGIEHETPSAGDLDEGQSYVIYPGNQGVPENVSFRAYGYVHGATDNADGAQIFIYKSDNPFRADYTLEGSIIGVDLRYDGLKLDGGVYAGGLWHALRHANGTWTQFGDVKGQAGNRGYVNMVACAGVNGELHLCTINSGNSSFWHTIRHANGAWTPFGNVEEQAGDRGNVASVSCAGVNGELHLCTINNDSGFWHTIRHADGTWQQFGDVKAATGNSAPVSNLLKVACADVNNELHVCVMYQTNILWHTIRHADGTWQQFKGIFTGFNFGISVDSIACAGVNGELHVCFASPVGLLWHTVRHANDTWQPFDDVKQQAGDIIYINSVACADVIGQLHLFTGNANGGLWHTVLIDGVWTPFEDIKGLAGNRGNVATVACAGVNNELQVSISI